MKKVVFLFFVFISVLSNAQSFFNVNRNVNHYLSDSAIKGDAGSTRPVKANNNIDGTPFLFNNWITTGVLETKDGKVFELNEINYDAKLDQMVVKISKDSIFSFNSGIIHKVVINTKVFKRYLDPELNRNSFYEVISESNEMSLLKRSIKKIRQGSVNPMTKVKLTSDSFITNEDYFLFVNGELKKQILSKRKFLKIFDTKSTQIKEFINTNDLSIRKDNDLKKIFNYYDAI